MHPLMRGLVPVLAVLLWSTTSGAATFVVNTIEATDDGVCAATAGGCTLVEAMNATVATAGLDTIAFDPAVFPPRDPAEISLLTAPPVLADPAGTVVDGTGAGVSIRASSASVTAFDGLVFASASGAPLAKVRVANVSVTEFDGTGIVVCGGAYPTCDGDVVTPIVENVVVIANEAAGLRIVGRDVNKARIVNVVARQNGQAGVRVQATRTLGGTRIEGYTAVVNGGEGIELLSSAGTTGTSVSDSFAVDNGGVGIEIRSEGTLAKTTLTRVGVSRNFEGIRIGAASTAGTTITDAAAVSNLFGGIKLTGGSLAGTTIKNVVASGNGGDGLELFAARELAGAKITGVRAVGNENGGIVAAADGDGSVVGVQLSRSAVISNGGIGLLLFGSRHVVKRVHADGNGAGIHLVGPGGDNVIQECTAHGNNGSAGGAGIRIGSGSTGNVLSKNAAQLNDGLNLEDGNPNCDGNLWKDNFAVTNAACLD